MTMARSVEKDLFLQPLPKLAARLRRDRRLGRAWQVIERDYADCDLSLETAAKESGMSRNHLNVILRESTGLTFYQLLIRYRLSRAMTMIEFSNRNLLEIALENGFGSLNSLEVHFRRLIGTSPKQFRNSRGLR